MKNPFSMVISIPLSERILFAHHLAMMTRAGMSVTESLGVVKRQIKSRAFAAILDKIVVDVQNGQFLSDSLKRYRQAFGDLFINVIRIGEMSGTLAENLDYLAVEMRKSQQLRGKVVGAMIYPIVIFIATLGITTGLLLFVFPKILPIFQRSKLKLPLPTRILVTIGTGFNQYYIYVFGVILLAAILFIFLIRLRSVKFFVHTVLLRVPVAGRVAINYNISTITRTLGILLKSQIRTVEAVQITADVVGNLVYKKALLGTAETLRRGEALYKFLEKNEHLFPPTVSRMVEVGEKTGNLEGNFNYLSEFYENEVDETLRNLSTVLEPFLLIFMGILVGFVALAIILPIYGITQTANG